MRGRALIAAFAVVGGIARAQEGPAPPASPATSTASASPSVSNLGEAPDPAEIDRLRREVTELKTRVEGRKSVVADASAEAKRIDLLVQLLGRERELAEAELKRATHEAKNLAEDIGRTSAARQQAVEKLGTRLGALYRLGNGGMMRLLLAPGSGDRMAMARTLAYLARRDRRLVRDLEERSRLLAEQSSNLTRVRELVTQLARRRLAKEDELREARNRQSLVAADLRHQQERDARRLTELQERAGRLERLLDLIQKSSRPMALQGESARHFRGALAWPLPGPVRSGFGRQKHPRWGAYVMNNGIEIDSPAGRGVAVVYPGRVLYAKWLQGYGNLVIVDHGDRFLTLYGKLAGVSVKEGDDVKMGQPVGAVSVPSEDEPTTLYFEIRDGGQAVDPVNWLRPPAGGSVK